MQHTRLPCPSLTLRACSNSCPLCQGCHPTISSSVVPFSSSLQSSPAKESFLMSQFFVSSGQSIGASALASILPMNIQDWFPLGWPLEHASDTWPHAAPCPLALPSELPESSTISGPPNLVTDSPFSILAPSPFHVSHNKSMLYGAHCPPKWHLHLGPIKACLFSWRMRRPWCTVRSERGRLFSFFPNASLYPRRDRRALG